MEWQLHTFTVKPSSNTFIVASVTHQWFSLLAEKSPNPSLLRLCGSLAQLACVEPVRLQAWLTRMTMSPPKDSDQLDVVQENRQLLQLLTTYIVRENRWSTAFVIFFVCSSFLLFSRRANYLWVADDLLLAFRWSDPVVAVCPEGIAVSVPLPYGA